MHSHWTGSNPKAAVDDWASLHQFFGFLAPSRVASVLASCRRTIAGWLLQMLRYICNVTKLCPWCVDLQPCGHGSASVITLVCPWASCGIWLLPWMCVCGIPGCIWWEWRSTLAGLVWFRQCTGTAGSCWLQLWFGASCTAIFPSGCVTDRIRHWWKEVVWPEPFPPQRKALLGLGAPLGPGSATFQLCPVVAGNQHSISTEICGLPGWALGCYSSLVWGCSRNYFCYSV